MRKFLKPLTNFMLILNPIAGFFIFASLFAGYWYLTPLFIIGIIFNFKLYFYAHKYDFLRIDVRVRNIKKTHKYIGPAPFEYGDYDAAELWQNELTGEIVEI